MCCTTNKKWNDLASIIALQVGAPNWGGGGRLGGRIPPEFWRGGSTLPDFEKKKLVAHIGPCLIA